MTVEEKLEIFWSENCLGKRGLVDSRWNKFIIGSLSFYLPNLSRKGYLLHDVNHLISGYGIDWLSEFEIAAWELASGGRKGFYLSWAYPVLGSLLGLIIIPKRTLAAFKKGSSQKNAHILSANRNILKMNFNELKQLSQKKSHL
ncbi:MAG: hypothetical protein MI974_13420 [Chitinophagales bacterium]|nr:hypothetical protein [Chitinophagales bacterium]